MNNEMVISLKAVLHGLHMIRGTHLPRVLCCSDLIRGCGSHTPPRPVLQSHDTWDPRPTSSRVGPTSHESFGAVIWLVGVGPTHLPRLSLQSHVTWDPRPTSSRVGPTSHESSGAVIWLVGVGPTHHHTSHESFDVVTWRVGPTHRPTRAGGSLYNWYLWRSNSKPPIPIFSKYNCFVEYERLLNYKIAMGFNLKYENQSYHWNYS